MELTTQSFWLGKEEKNYVTSKHKFVQLVHFIEQNTSDFEIVEISYFAAYIFIKDITEKQAKKIHNFEIELKRR